MSCTFWGILRDWLLVNQRLTTGIIALVLCTLVLALFLAALPARSAEPRLRADGPDADAYGRAKGYPHCEGLAYTRELGCWVGALLRGLRGQWVIVDPVNKLVLVQTSLRDGGDPELMALWASLEAQVP
jgi:hypothetical protein